MKKLMIAAAVAAMIGGVQAYEAYDFSATLKTTTAKAGKGYTDNYKVQLGQDTDGNWWYNDGQVFDAEGKFDGVKVLSADSKGVGKLNVKGLDDFQKLALAEALYDYALITENGKAEYGKGVPAIYKGKATWCATYTFKIVTPGQCYRVAGTEKISTKYIADCCNTSIATFTCDTAALTAGDMVLPDLTADLYFRFGGETFEASKKVEFVGQIGNGVADPSNFTTDILPTFALAGQGSVAVLKDAEGVSSVDPILSTLSGNIVGIWLDPECEVCCGDNAIAIVFDCDGDDNIGGQAVYAYAYAVDVVTDISNIGPQNNVVYWYGDTFYKSSGVQNLWGTAAYGTFTLKFNKKNSSFIY